MKELEIFVPVSLDGDHKDARSIAGSILTQYNAYGFKRFCLSMPRGGWRSVSYPPREFFEKKADLFLQVRSLLPREISCGWWHTLVLKSGPTPGYTRILRLNGTEAPFSSCPLDPAYRKRFAEDVAFVLAKAHPDFFITEDDFGISCHGGLGCFCKHHLEEFARREGRYYSREELEILFTERKAESRELLRRWETLSADSLALFAAAIREEADKLTPEIPMGIMDPGCSEKDGNSTEKVARAIAGKNHTPFARFHGTFYCGENIPNIPWALFHALYAKEHIKGKFRFIHESDTYPHTRFYTSGASMRAMMGAIYSCGYDGSVFQTQQLLDDPDEENTYGTMFMKERTRFNALSRHVEGCTLEGVRIFYDPFEKSNFPKNDPEWLRVMSSFGIPYTSKESVKIVCISGEQLRFVPAEKIRELLSGSVILDGDAAKLLTERGFSELLGAEVTEPLIEGNARFDLGAREELSPDILPELKGRQMHRADMYCPHGTGLLYRVKITDPACEEITKVINFKGEYTAPGMTFFRNALGGNVVIYATALANHFGSSLFNYRRQALIQELLIRCGTSFPMVRKAPKVFLTVNVPQKEKEFRRLITAINLAADPLEELELYLPEELRDCNDFSYLDQQGQWQKTAFEKLPEGVLLKHRFNCAEPVFIAVR